MEGTNDLPIVDAADAEAALARIIEQMEGIRAEMQRDDAEIARLKAETTVLTVQRRVLDVLPFASFAIQPPDSS